MKFNKKVVLVLSIALFITSTFAMTRSVHAAIIPVIPGPGTPLQNAINAANPLGGDTIVVAAGTYTENIVINKWLTLQGAGSGSNPASNTIITGSAAINTPTITLACGGSSPTNRMIITNIYVTGATGTGNAGSGIKVNDPGTGASHITFDNVASVANGANGIGFDVYVSTDILLNNCVLSNNGNAGLRFPASATSLSDVTVNDCTFDHNSQGDPNADCSGIISYSHVDGFTVNGGKFTNNNVAGGQGWGIFFDVEYSGEYVRNVIVTGAVFDNNYRGFQVGIYTDFSPTPTHDISNIQVHGCSFTNSLDQGVRFYAGGAGYESDFIDARHNWWGDATGPYHATSWIYPYPSGPPYGPHLGSGDAVSDYVLYDPWQIPVTFSETGLSSDASGTVLTVGATTYTYLTFPSSVMWLDYGTTYSYTGTVPGSGKQYVLTSVTGPTSPIHTSGTVTGNYKTQYYLSVASQYDSPTGAGWHDAGSVVTASVAPSVGHELATGWTGTGSVPATGSGPTVTFTMSQASSITWLWEYTVVGGEWGPITLQAATPINTLQLLASWITLALLAAASAFAVYRRFLKKRL